MDSPAAFSAYDPARDQGQDSVENTERALGSLSAVEQFAALIDAICAALLAEYAPRTWLGLMFGRLSRRLLGRMCADLRAASAALRALGAGAGAGWTDAAAAGGEDATGHARLGGDSPPLIKLFL